MKIITKATFFFMVLLALISCKNVANEIVKVQNGQFVKNEKPYYFMGTNFWYGAILGSKGPGGDRDRLEKELDFMKSIGICNLRVMVGADGSEGNPYRVQPTLQSEPGKYDTDLLEGLDFLLAEMGKRDMTAVLFLINSWDWSGGYGQYLEWNGYGESPLILGLDFDWNEYQKLNGRFNHCKECIEQYHKHIRYIIGRTNSITGTPYINDPAIMTWEVGNEPRAFGNENIDAFKKMVASTVALIKELDPNHLVTTGTEGSVGCQNSIELFEEIHADPNIDYLTFHVWPKNWRYIDWDNIPGTIDAAIERTNIYMEQHIEVARRLNKPLVAEEFGVPRDYHGYLTDETAYSRDKYYENIFKKVVKHAETGDVLGGSNFWTWGGFGRPSQVWHSKGDDYLGDPPCEEQGLNSVYSTDTTIELIRKYSDKLK